MYIKCKGMENIWNTLDIVQIQKNRYIQLPGLMAIS